MPDPSDLKPLLEIKDLTAGTGDAILIQDVNWTIKPGEQWIVRGDTGSGKTSLVKAITGKLHIRNGTITYPFLGPQPTFDERRAAVQMVSFTDTSRLFNPVETTHYYQQRYHAFDSEGHLTVREYLQRQGFDPENQESQHLLSSFGIQQLLDRERIKLSSGQTRKLLLVKALMHHPSILILDNACLGLDVASVKVLFELLEEVIQYRSISIVLTEPLPYRPDFITHELQITAGRVVLQVTQDGPSSNAKVLEQQHALERVMAYYQTTAFSETSSELLRMENIQVNYLDASILKNFNWRVLPGEKWVLSGPNGVGKSTLLAMIYADHPQVYSNQVYLFGHRRGHGDTIWEVKKRIGFSSPELHAYFHSKASALDVILTGLEDRFQLLHAPDPKAVLIAKAMLNYVGRESLCDQRFPTLSTGEQRLILFLRALIKAPELLLLDEPYQGLDEDLIGRCNDLLEACLTPSHCLIFITHRTEEVPGCVSQYLALQGE